MHRMQNVENKLRDYGIEGICKKDTQSKVGKSEVTAQHHQDLMFESPTQVFVSMQLPQKGPSVTTGSPVGIGIVA